MKLFEILKAIIIGLFLILVAGKYFSFIDNYPITSNFYLYDITYVFLILYIIVRIAEFISNRKSTENEKK